MKLLVFFWLVMTSLRKFRLVQVRVCLVRLGLNKKSISENLTIHALKKLTISWFCDLESFFNQLIVFLKLSLLPSLSLSFSICLSVSLSFSVCLSDCLSLSLSLSLCLFLSFYLSLSPPPSLPLCLSLPLSLNHINTNTHIIVYFKLSPSPCLSLSLSLSFLSLSNYQIKMSKLKYNWAKGQSLEKKPVGATCVHG